MVASCPVGSAVMFALLAVPHCKQCACRHTETQAQVVLFAAAGQGTALVNTWFGKNRSRVSLCVVSGLVYLGDDDSSGYHLLEVLHCRHSRVFCVMGGPLPCQASSRVVCGLL